MGIKGLMKLINEHAATAVKEKDIASYFGLKVAVDASMSLYQFLIAVRHGPDAQNLTNDQGEVTSHLQGMFYRTIRMIDNGIKPVFVFDGKPPQLKSQELAKRLERRAEAEEELKQAQAEENQEEINKYNKRMVKVTKEHNEETRKLLRLMGVPIIEAPGEAEATCAHLAKHGKVFGVATEDMDALTFSAPKLLRHMTFSAAKKEPIVEVDLQQVLKGLDLTMEQFVELCILLGCDYTSSIKGVGPQTAYKWIKEYGSIEQIMKKIDKDRYKIPEDFQPMEAKELFIKPEVIENVEDVKLVWSEPDEEALIEFLVNEKGFNLERVKAGIQRLKAAKTKSSQKRMESFFTAVPQPNDAEKQAARKRKQEEEKKSQLKGKAKGLSKFANSKKTEEKKTTTKKARSSKKKEPPTKKQKTKDSTTETITVNEDDDL